jgi:hypothetical protein
LDALRLYKALMEADILATAFVVLDANEATNVSSSNLPELGSNEAYFALGDSEAMMKVSLFFAGGAPPRLLVIKGDDL